MRIVLSRKGFDSSAGGTPSPIIHGRPISLPIPTSPDRSRTTYNDLELGAVVERVTNGRIDGSHACHEDPMFLGGRCAFGQTSAAQTHLSNNAVGVGDAFLFFGLFREEVSGEPHHRIFGFLRVECVIHVGASPGADDGLIGFARPHPHTIGPWNSNNVIYVGTGSSAKMASPILRLTAPNCGTSVWQVPQWLKTMKLSYHGSPERWLDGNRLASVGRGQEFVSDIGDDEEANAWVNHIIEAIMN